jgi:hypothetical protein
VPSEALTPSELEKDISMGEQEKHIFHTIYEKARYGNEPCTKEEATSYHF